MAIINKIRLMFVCLSAKINVSINTIGKTFRKPHARMYVHKLTPREAVKSIITCFKLCKCAFMLDCIPIFCFKQVVWMTASS